MHSSPNVKTAARILVHTLLLIAAQITRADSAHTFGSLTGPFLERHCLDCHDADTQKGGVALHDLDGVTSGNAEMWKRIWEQVALKEMPPRKRKSQPDPRERLAISNWITGQLVEAMKDQGGFSSHLHPAKGNHLDHDLLFGPIPDDLEPPSTPARIWRIHPQEHLTRLNELISFEPPHDPKRPGMRAHGDGIPANMEGEVKVYFGIDRIIGWAGGSAAYAAAITGFPSVLTTVADHGLRNYPVLYSVNGSEATQIANTAEDVLRFMAYGPKAEPFQFGDTQRDIVLPEEFKGRDIRGLAQSVYYAREPKRPLTPVYELAQADGTPEDKLVAAVNFLFEALTFRPPSGKETGTYLGLLKDAIDDLGKEDGIILGLVPIFLDRDALFRPELAAYGKPDKHGRVMLRGHELAMAVNAAFRYLPPDEPFRQALAEGRLKTRGDVRREVTRILEDDSIRKPRILQFFREFFDYDRAGQICKDTAALRAAGGDLSKYYVTMFSMAASTDRLVEMVLQEDKNVLAELLTTDRVVLHREEDLRYFSHLDKLVKNPPKPDRKKNYTPSARELGFIELPEGEPTHIRIEKAIARFGPGLGGDPNRELTTLPREQRMGILTHPSWLVSHSDAMDNHAILRGRWVRERLLGGAVPDIPITVDAMLPDEPGETLRHRMRVTLEQECWRCHQKMDPLGLPFESYTPVGLFRLFEQGKPVDTSGEIIDSGEPALDGPVEDVFEMIRKLAASERVEQVFVRHAFRYWMGRNESLSDAPVLQAAHRAYRESGGSMKALLTALVTSDAFLYRKVMSPQQQ
jgi:hypothetical protein